MPFNDTSILRNLPRMNNRDLLILDSVRFSAEMVEYSFNQLERQIDILSVVPEGNKHLPSLFLYAWNTIDHAQRMLKIITNLDSKTNHLHVRELIQSIRLPRNTYQHLDERIDKALLNNESPFFGKLKWCYSYEDGTFANFIAISGAHFSKTHRFSYGEYSSQPIKNIILETVDTLNPIEINLSELKCNLHITITNLEDRLTTQFKEKGWNCIDRSSTTDILLRLLPK